MHCPFAGRVDSSAGSGSGQVFLSANIILSTRGSRKDAASPIFLLCDEDNAGSGDNNCCGNDEDGDSSDGDEEDIDE